MENISQEKLTAFKGFLDELRSVLQPYFKDRHLTLSNKQLFSFVLNSPFVLGVIADGKQTFKEAVRRVLLDSEYYIYPEHLPNKIFDQFTDPEDCVLDKDFEDTRIGEESYLLNNFVKYEDMLVNMMQLYCSKTKCIDKYEIITKISHVTHVDLKDDAVRNQQQWSFLKKAGITLEPFDKNKYSFSDEEWTQVYSLPYLVFYLVGSADQKVSGKEVKEFNNFLRNTKEVINPLIVHIMKQASIAFNDGEKDFVVGKHKEILGKFKTVASLLQEKLSYYDFFEISRMCLRLGYDIADAAGFFGISFVGYQEAVRLNEITKVLNLSQIDGKPIKFAKKIKYGNSEIRQRVVYKMLYANHVTEAILREI